MTDMLWLAFWDRFPQPPGRPECSVRQRTMLSHYPHWPLWRGWSLGQILYVREPDTGYVQCAMLISMEEGFRT